MITVIITLKGDDYGNHHPYEGDDAGNISIAENADISSIITQNVCYQENRRLSRRVLALHQTIERVKLRQRVAS